MVVVASLNAREQQAPGLKRRKAPGSDCRLTSGGAMPKAQQTRTPERRKGGSGSVAAAGGTPDPWMRQVFASDQYVEHGRQLVHLGEVHMS
jgi:hypothetical protein